MNSKQAKEKIKELLYPLKDINELTSLLKRLSRHEDKNFPNIHEEWMNLVGKNQDNKIDSEIFKLAWMAKGCGGLYYYASNSGRIILTPKNDNEVTIEDLKNDYSWVKIKNGYLTNEGLKEGYSVALYTDVYTFVAEAFQQEFFAELEDLKKMFPAERLELHHINNNPNDNRLDNLIYLPKSIHMQAH